MSTMPSDEDGATMTSDEDGAVMGTTLMLCDGDKSGSNGLGVCVHVCVKTNDSRSMVTRLL